MKPIIINPSTKAEKPKLLYMPWYATWDKKESIFSVSLFIDKLMKKGHDIVGYNKFISVQIPNFGEYFGEEWVIIEVNVEWDEMKISILLNDVVQIYEQNKETAL